MNAVTLYATCADSLIGVDVTGVDDVLRSHLGLAAGQGVVVTAVADDSPASRAGIVKNDVLVSVGDQPVTGVECLQNLLQGAVDKATNLALIRSGQQQTVEVTPQSQAARLTWALSETLLAAPQFWLGVGLANADDTLRSHLGIAGGEGLVVTSVENESPAAKAGVMLNDLLLKLDGKALSTIESLTAQLQEIGGRSAPLELLRRGKPASLTVTPEQRADYANFVTHLIRQDDLERVFVTFPQAVEAIDPLTVTTGVRELAAYQLWSVERQPADLARQVTDLLEQAKRLEKALEEVKHLQKSLEALDAAVKAQAQAPSEEKKSP
jgi:predicted metalloprotease with PDZ domain